MARWLAAGALLVVAGLLAGLLVVLLGLVEHGVTLRLHGPIELAGEPQTQQLNVDLRLTEPIRADLGGPLDLRATVQGIPCPDCDGGTLLPLRWNLLTGEITWRCVGCEGGQTGR